MLVYIYTIKQTNKNIMTKQEIKEIAITSGCKFDSLTKEQQELIYTSTTMCEVFKNLSDVVNQYTSEWFKANKLTH